MSKWILRACGAVVAAAISLPVSASVVVPDNGAGRFQFPPVLETYAVVPGYPLFHIVDGLAPGETIDCDIELSNFFNVVDGPGGSLGGSAQSWNAFTLWTMQGTGSLSYARFAGMQVQGQTHLGPHTPYTPAVNMPTDLYTLQGQLPPGDPDFDLLRFTAGTGFGLPSPGVINASPTGPNWTLDSFFDITYRIDFIGSPGGPFAGRSGSTTGTTRIYLVPEPGAVVGLALTGLLVARGNRRAAPAHRT